jgi:hypothetical protein
MAGVSSQAWVVRHQRSDTLPPMAWLARVRPPLVELLFGGRVTSSEAGIFEGTWVGEPGALGPLRSTTPFGSGVLVDGEALWIVPPGHMLEGVYVHRRDGGVVASNSLVALLAATGLELDGAVAYPALFNQSVLGRTRTTIPTTTEPFEACFHDNLLVAQDATIASVAKPREAPFAGFSDYRTRLKAELASALANAPPLASDPVVTVSAGYDSAAVAVLAAELGCHRAVTIRQGKPIPGSASDSDDGTFVAAHLGYEVTALERTAFQQRSDLPEAEFLASGFTGEEVVLSGAEPLLRGGLLVSGFFGDGMWWLHRPPRPLLWRSDQSGSSLAEWRLRVGFVHVPLPCFGSTDYRVTNRISHSPEMRPWVIGKRSEKPIPRRILEEAGVPRGTFGEPKRAASATIHVDGPAVLAPATRQAVAAFAAAHGQQLRFRRRRFAPWRKGLLKIARRAGVEPIAARLERPKHRLAVLDAEFGSLLLRWAVSVVRSRYAELEPSRTTVSPRPEPTPAIPPGRASAPPPTAPPRVEAG